MAPIASTSSSGAGTAASATVKLTSTEKKMIEVGLAKPQKQISQAELMAKCGLQGKAAEAAVNSLLRKNLAQLLKLPDGSVEFRFLQKAEAKTMGSMDAEERMVLDQIKDADNQGIWTKFLHNKTGLPRTTINKVLKTLESRKTVKTVKSVKHPTRKIYMMANIAPSVDLTGGPWFTDNELDIEFVEALQKISWQYLASRTRPKGPKLSKLAPGERPRQPVWHVGESPYLPKVRDVLNYIMSKGIAVQVELNEEHVESLLELMIYEGTVERILVQTPEILKSKKGKKRKRFPGDTSDEDDSDVGRGKKGKQRNKTKGSRKSNGKAAKKKKRLTSTNLDDDDDEDDNQSSASDDDFDEDEDQEAYQRRKAAREEENGDYTKSTKRRQKPRNKKVGRSVKKEDGDSDVSMDEPTSESSASEVDEEDENDALRAHQREGGVNDYVYRAIKAYEPVIGWTDMPCGKCPVESFCTEPERRFAPAVRRPNWVTGRKNPASTYSSGLPPVGVELDGGMQGVGMLGGAGAAIGVSSAKWGETRGAVGAAVAPVNPKDCHYFKKWLDF